MPNILAYFMIWSWPVLMVIFCRRLPLRHGMLISMIGAYLLLPTRPVIDMPFLPPYEKNMAGIIAALLMILLDKAKKQPLLPSARVPEEHFTVLPGWIPRHALIRLCLAGLFGGFMATAYMNPNTLVYGPKVLPGLTLYDGLSQMIAMAIFIAPMLLARKYLADEKSQVLLLRFLVIGVAWYCLLAMWEIRMSPQLNLKIYGFFPHSWLQHIRGGGFRPLVFLVHGLRLSLLLALATLAAISLTRINPDGKRKLFVWLAVLLFVTLVMSKSLGAVMICLCFIPFAIWASARVQILVATVIVAIGLSYPILRGSGLVPTDTITSIAAAFGEDRVQSFTSRLRWEDRLLDKAQRKPLLGWGAWGRGQDYDAVGRNASIADGYWIIILGAGGWLRYLSSFGLLGLPVLILARRRYRMQASMTTAALATLIAANIVDLFPNTGLTMISWLIIGSLTGWLEVQAATQKGTLRQAHSPGGNMGGLGAGTATAREAEDDDDAPDRPEAPPRPRSPYTPVLRDNAGLSLSGVRK